MEKNMLVVDIKNEFKRKLKNEDFVIDKSRG